MPNVVGTYLCPHRQVAYMWACRPVLLVLLFINPLLLLVCLCVLWVNIIVLVVLSSVCPFVWYSVFPSVCLSVCMFTCTYVETNLLVCVLWTSKIELTWLIPCLACQFFGAVFASKGYPFKNIFDFTTAGDWDCVEAVERLPALHYSVDFIFLSFGIMGFIVELWNY